MRLPLPRIVLLITALTALLGVLAPATASAAGVLAVRGGISDNYKARYNSDPSTPEHRTYLSMDSVVVEGVTWAPTAPGSGSVFATSLAVSSSDGRTGTMTLTKLRGSLGVTTYRTDAPTASIDHMRWGVLTAINDPGAMAAQSALVQLNLVVGGATFATGVVEYRHEPAFDGVASTHIEWNGPRGRWHVGGSALLTDWEPAGPVTTLTANAPGTTTSAPPAPGGTGDTGTAPPAGSGGSAAARPRIVGVTMKRVTANRRVPVRVSGRGVGPKVTSIRFRIGVGKWTSWQRVKPAGYRLTFGARDASYRVGFQLRDASGLTSLPAYRSLRCNCG